MTTPSAPVAYRARIRLCALCQHEEVFHKLNSKDERTLCSTSTGPQASPCPCHRYTPAEEP